MGCSNGTRHFRLASPPDVYLHFRQHAVTAAHLHFYHVDFRRRETMFSSRGERGRGHS